MHLSALLKLFSPAIQTFLFGEGEGFLYGGHALFSYRFSFLVPFELLSLAMPRTPPVFSSWNSRPLLLSTARL